MHGYIIVRKSGHAALRDAVDLGSSITRRAQTASLSGQIALINQ